MRIVHYRVAIDPIRPSRARGTLIAGAIELPGSDPCSTARRIFALIAARERRLTRINPDAFVCFDISMHQARAVSLDEPVQVASHDLALLYAVRPQGPLAPIFLIAGLVLTAATIGYSIYQYIDLKNQLAALRNMDPTADDASGSQAYSYEHKANYMTDSTPIPVLYGETKLGGVVINRCIWTPSGSSAEVARVLLALCEGPVEAVAPNGAEDITLDDSPLTAYSNASYAVYRGLPTESVPAGHEELYQQQYPDTGLRNHLVAYFRWMGTSNDGSYIWSDTDENHREWALSPVEDHHITWSITIGGQRCIRLDSTDSYMYLGDATDLKRLQPRSEAFAAHLWFYLTQDQLALMQAGTAHTILYYAPMMSDDSEPPNGRFAYLCAVRQSGNSMYFMFHSRTYEAEGSDQYWIAQWSRLITLTTNTWHHLYFSRVGRTYRWYLDGADISEAADVTTNYIRPRSDDIACTGYSSPRCGVGRMHFHTDASDDRLPAFPVYMKQLAIHIGQVPYLAPFTPPGIDADYRDLWMQRVGILHRTATCHLRGRADKIGLSYRFDKGLYDDADPWKQAFSEDITYRDPSGTERQLKCWQSNVPSPYGATIVEGKWLGAYTNTVWISYDYIGISANSGTWYIGETIRTTTGAGRAVIAGAAPDASSPERLYLKDITQPGAFIGSHNIVGEASGRTATITQSLITKEIASDSTIYPMARMPMRGAGTQQVNEAKLYSITAVRRLALKYPRVAKVAVEVAATDRLARVPRINIIVRRGDLSLNVWNGRAYVPITVPSTNPAWAAYDILTNTQYGRGIEGRRIDYWSFSDWASYCDTLVLDPPEMTTASPRCRVSGVFDQKNMSTLDALEQILQVGRARLSTTGSSIYARVNRPTVPCMIINSAMYERDSLSVEWIQDPQRPDILRLQFLDAARKYEQNEVEAICDELSEDPVASRQCNIATIFVPFITSYGQALREAQLRLRTARAVSRRYTWRMDIEGINLEVGDVVLLQSEANRLSYGARVVAVDVPNHRIQIDRQIMLAASIYSSESTRIVCRSNDTDLIYQFSIQSPYDTTTDTFTVAAIPGGPGTDEALGDISRYDPVAIGRYGQDLEPVRIDQITIEEDLRMACVAYNYDESVYTEQEAG